MSKKYIISGIVIFILVVLSLYIMDKVSSNNNSFQSKKEIIDYYTGEGKEELILKVAEKNGDWSDLPLTTDFREKYNSKDGIFGKMEFDNIELNPYTYSQHPIGTRTHLLITKGKEKIAYIYKRKYAGRGDGWIDDVILYGPYIIVDRNGKNTNFKFPFDDEYYVESINSLTYNYELESSVGVTDNFHQKYPHFLDLFIHYSPLSYNRITFIERESDLENNVAVFKVVSDLECKTRKYKVKLYFDDRFYLDDADVELIEEKEFQGDAKYRSIKIYYKNSNWDGLKLSKSFLKKYDSINGTFNDIDKIDIDVECNAESIGYKKYIETVKYIDGTEAAYIRELIINSRDELEDVFYKKIDYNGETIEELVSKYKEK